MSTPWPDLSMGYFSRRRAASPSACKSEPSERAWRVRESCVPNLPRDAVAWAILRQRPPFDRY